MDVSVIGKACCQLDCFMKSLHLISDLDKDGEITRYVCVRFTA